MAGKQVLIIGGGVAGLSAAVEVAQFGADVQIVDKADFMGGHAIQYTCKATDRCVKCGACMVEDKLLRAVTHPNISLITGGRIREISKNGRFTAVIDRKPAYIDPDKCTDCGLCFNKCPVDGAFEDGFSSQHHPFFTINEDNCLYVKDGSCTICQDACPENAIDLEKKPETIESHPDAVVMATGFTPFDPVSKPYGYGTFQNVVTTLELERMLRRSGRVKRPSDDKDAQRIAFIQCVGSRDSKLGHLWCSKVCCGSALRMAGLIKSRQADVDLTFFYIDVQSFGKDFDRFYPLIQDDVRIIRSIPGDIYPDENDRLKIIYADSKTHQSTEEGFDLVVLSVGMTPCDGIKETADRINVPLADTGFIKGSTEPGDLVPSDGGVFIAGSAKGPMHIAESITDAGKAAWDVLNYLQIEQGEES
jgi:heterodisulfide reductase subunit A